MLNHDKRKSLQQFQNEDSVSIFDSEEEGQHDKKTFKNKAQFNRKGHHDRKKQKQNSRRRFNLKNREKELDMAEYQIMRKLMGPQATKQAKKAQQKPNQYENSQSKGQDKQGNHVLGQNQEDYTYRDLKTEDNCIIEGGEDEMNLQQIYVQDGLMDYDQHYNKTLIQPIRYKDHPYQLQNASYNYMTMPSQSQSYRNPYTNNPYPHHHHHHQHQYQNHHQHQNHHNHNHHNKYSLYQQGNTQYRNNNQYSFLSQQRLANNDQHNIEVHHRKKSQAPPEHKNIKIRRLYDNIGKLKQQYRQLSNTQIEFHQNVIDQANKVDHQSKSKTEAQLQFVQSILQSNPYIYISEIIHLITNANHLNITNQILYNLLRISSYAKRPLQNLQHFNKNSEYNVQTRYQYCLSLQQHRTNNYNLIYYDEFIIHQFYDRTSVWCKKMNNKRQLYEYGNLQKSLVVACFLSLEDSICHWNLKFGGFSAKEQLQLAQKQLKHLNNAKQLLIFNRYSHDIVQMTQLMGQKDLKILKLADNCNELNPLNCIFDSIRTSLISHHCDSLQKLTSKVISLFQKANTDKLGEKYVKEVQGFIEKSVKRQYF